MANTREFLNGKCFKDFKEISIQFVFTFTLQIEFLCISDVIIERFGPSLKFIDESRLDFQFPDVTLKGTSRIKVV